MTGKLWSEFSFIFLKQAIFDLFDDNVFDSNNEKNPFFSGNLSLPVRGILNWNVNGKTNQEIGEKQDFANRGKSKVPSFLGFI